jgi:PAS domain-containing protein
MIISRKKNRELFNLSLVVVITIILTLFSLFIDFVDKIHEYLSVYSTLPISELFIKVLFVWLVLTLWVTYKRWRKATNKQMELEDIISIINSRKQAEEALIKSEKRYHSLIENASDAIISINKEGIIIISSPCETNSPMLSYLL